MCVIIFIVDVDVDVDVDIFDVLLLGRVLFCAC